MSAGSTTSPPSSRPLRLRSPAQRPRGKGAPRATHTSRTWSLSTRSQSTPPHVRIHPLRHPCPCSPSPASSQSTPVVSFPPAFLGRPLTGRPAPATSLLLATTPWGVFLIFFTLCPCCSCRHTLHDPVRHCRGVASRPSADICRECRAIQAPQGDDGEPKGRGGADPAPPDAVGRQ